MKQWSKLFLPTSLTLACLASATASAATVDLRVLETTDIHMHLVDYDYYADKQSNSVGLSRVATLIKQARAEVQNSVLVDNGCLLYTSDAADE